MLGLSGPSDYSQEPSRHPCLHINAKASFSFVLLCHSLIGVSSSKPLTSLVQEPFNAEPPRSALVSSYVTPVELFFKRNHGPIPLVDDIERYCVDISGLIETPKKLYFRDIRRTAMSITRKVKGVGWDVSAIGNAVWGGAKLADILELLGVPKLTSSTQSGGKHIEFVSIDKCQVEENGGPYKASIPLSQATNPEADVLLAYEMNGEVSNFSLMIIFFPTLGKTRTQTELNKYAKMPLNRDHGYPLRVIVPGVIGARSVKWLDSINIIAEECQGFFMQKDYKMFPPSVDWGNINWNTRKPQMDFPVQSVICSLEDVQSIKPGKVRISGYAVSGGGRGIERVDVSIDGGKTWMEATRFQKTGIPYIADGISNDKWAWVLFELTVDIPQSTEIIAKAVDSAANVQPEKVQDIWNLRGILNTSWHRVHVRVGHSNM
ncbi:Sulfite oxidase [Gossypium australe]|uniref:Sulfite oxidase n=1 Tax=Gossypium australe TaxID=47621 RepID=A0A5B6UPY2_9ROSI|nr:Sulfite oxidase [Gossypium australe]